MFKRLLFTLIVIGVLISFFVTIKMNIKPKPVQPKAITKAEKAEKADEGIKIKGELDLRNAFVKVADEVGPAVVTITIQQTQKVQGMPQRQFFFRRFGNRDFFGEEDPFERFFDDFFGNMPEREFKRQGLGSGFIIDKEGNILTNHHVVENADKITVVLPDGRSFPATVKGSDPRSDLAIIKIEASNLPAVTLGDSDNLKTGEWVVAIGNPFGHVLRSPQPTVTVGVISALHRQIPSGDQQSMHLDMIQTDAAINLGNSGGPLCNILGEVIGINVAIFSTTGGNQGVGFAIPINMAKDILGELVKGKGVSYGWLGVQAQEVTQDIAEYFNLGEKKGVLIAKVFENSPAQKADIKEGDIVIEFGGEKVSTPFELVRKVGKTKPGESVTVKLIRDRVEKTLTAVIDTRPLDEESLEAMPLAPEEKESSPWRGIKVANITDEIASELGLKDKKGVVIIDIDPQSPFYMMGMRRGDIIREINRNLIKDVKDFNKITKEAKGKVLIRTDNGYFVIEER